MRTLLIHGVNFDGVDENIKTPLHYAAEYGDFEIVRILLTCGANPGKYDYGHLSPLHLAVYCKRLETVTIMLEFDSVRRTLGMITEDNDTALHLAVEGEHTDII